MRIKTKIIIIILLLILIILPGCSKNENIEYKSELMATTFNSFEILMCENNSKKTIPMVIIYDPDIFSYTPLYPPNQVKIIEFSGNNAKDIKISIIDNIFSNYYSRVNDSIMVSIFKVEIEITNFNDKDDKYISDIIFEIDEEKVKIPVDIGLKLKSNIDGNYKSISNRNNSSILIFPLNNKQYYNATLRHNVIIKSVTDIDNKPINDLYIYGIRENYTDLLEISEDIIIDEKVNSENIIIEFQYLDEIRFYRYIEPQYYCFGNEIIVRYQIVETGEEYFDVFFYWLL